MQHLQEDIFVSCVGASAANVRVWDGRERGGVYSSELSTCKGMWDHGILAWDSFSLLYKVLWKL